MPDSPITNFRDSDGVDLGRKLVTKDYLLEVYGTILENSPASGLVVTPELWAWGMINDGRLGINVSGFESRSTPITTFAGGTNWKQVSTGDRHSAAIKTDGSLWLWGENSDAPLLGTNDAIDRITPVTTFAGGNDWKQVSAGGGHTSAIKTDGSLWIWGSGSNGVLGNNDTTSRSTPITTFAGGNNWKQVSAGGGHTSAIKTDGSLWVWGIFDGGRLGNRESNGSTATPITTFAGGNNWKQVSSGSPSAAIKTDGTLWVWGSNNVAQLGVNDTTNRNTPVTTFAGGNDWKQVFGSGTPVAIKTDGSLWTWGFGTSGQLGNNNNTNRSTPVTTFAGGNNWKSVAGGDQFTLAIKTDGSLWSWGKNSNGQLGINNTDNRSTPVTTFAGGNNWKSIAGGGNFTAAIQTIDYI